MEPQNPGPVAVCSGKEHLADGRALLPVAAGEGSRCPRLPQEGQAADEEAAAAPAASAAAAAAEKVLRVLEVVLEGLKPVGIVNGSRGVRF